MVRPSVGVNGVRLDVVALQTIRISEAQAICLSMIRRMSTGWILVHNNQTPVTVSD